MWIPRLLSWCALWGQGSAATPCGSFDLDQWIYKVKGAPGYHVICVDGPSGCTDLASGSCPADAPIGLTVYWNGNRDMKQIIDTPPVEELVELETLLTNTRTPTNPDRHGRIKTALEKKEKYKGIYGFFIADANDGVPTKARSAGDVLVQGNVVLVMEGGQWLWPGIEIGFERAVHFKPYKPLDSDPELNVTIVTKSLNPLVVEVSQFLTSEQATYMIERTKPHIKKSPVSHMDHDVGKPDTNWRTSSQHFLPSDTAMLQLVDRQVAALANVKRNHQEHFQVLRYEKGERYVAHHDYFDPRMYAKNEGIQSMTKRGLFNRMATVFFYLSDVEAGGSTNFPRAGGLPQPSDFGDCSKGISVTPKEGRIIIFYSLKANGAGDELSLHGGCAVEKGTKWSANKWIWNKPMDYTRD